VSVPRILVVVGLTLVSFSRPGSAQEVATSCPAPLSGSAVLQARTDSAGPLLGAAIRASHRLEAAARPAHAPSAEPQTGRGWIARHPVFFGALVGGAAGSLAIGLTDRASGHPEPGEAYSMGFGLGAAAGAIVGALVGR
jgi:hypothetical protein